MKLGITLSWPDETAAIGPEVTRIARLADEAGLDSLWTADHLFQIPVTSLPREAPMLEAYALLAYLAGQTEQIRLGALVTCAVYRHPGMLIKAVTALDVLSGGRVMFGVGAGWDVEEATSLGIPFPSTAERFERLEELLCIARQMWAGDETPFDGRYHHLARPLNSPGCLQRPHPPILIGGGGERRTLRLVAEHADACNLFDIPGPYAVDLRHKLAVLRAHCADVGRDEATIEKTTTTRFAPGAEHDEMLAHIEDLAAIGIDHVIVIGQEFEWGSDLDAVLSLAADVHAITP